MRVVVTLPFGCCDMCEMFARVWEVESSDVLLCGICLRLLVATSLEDFTQPS